MIAFVIAFAAGIVWLQQQAELPADALLSLLAMGGAVALNGALWRPRWQPWWQMRRWLAPVGAFVVGIAWAGGLAQQRLGDSLTLENEVRDLELVGVVAELPQRFDNGLRFGFAVEQAPAGVPQHISVAWYRSFRADEENQDAERQQVPDLRAGERWRLTVRLKRPHGNFNPHGFDIEGWLLESGVRATGYVRAAPTNLRLDSFVTKPDYAIERLRQTIRDRMLAALADQPYAGILIALVIGDQQAIDTDLWQIFSQTGLTHLMSISGLHVTMVAGIVYALFGWLWRRSPWLMLRLPAQQAAAVGGMLGALVYCLLAGFAVPAQRTLYMLSAVALALWTRRNVASASVLAFALLVVLVLDPWAVLSAGFWLSFGCVAMLSYAAAGQLNRPHWLREWAHAQWAVTVGMIPAVLALFQQFSLVSPLANAVAIPVVSLVVTPMALAACLLPEPLHGWLLWLAHAITALLMAWVEWLAALPWAMWQQHAPPDWAVLAGMFGVLWLMLPRGFPARWVGVFLLAPLVFVPPPRPTAGQADLVVLDVGQGLAVHVQTATHDLLYDAGPIFSPDANSGNRIIVPYLRAVGVRRIDAFVLSHQDKDHSGGAESVIDALPVSLLTSSLPFEHELSGLPVAQSACHDGQNWEWDGVRFEMLYPSASQYEHRPKKTNDMSCVLKVTAAGHSVLLTSDIEAWSEDLVLAAHPGDVKSDVLLVPHHGSRTSSTPAFIAAVAASQVIFPVGYRNRFNHPRPDVVERYRASGAGMSRTDRDGALTIRLGNGGAQIVAERRLRARYWHGR